MTHFPRRLALAGLAALAAVLPAEAQDAVRLRESFVPGYVYDVSSRVELSGTIALPPEKGKSAAQSLTVTGKSAIEYEERVLAQGAGGRVDRTVRAYRRLDFERKVGPQQEQTTLRPAVRRMVVLRHDNVEVPFSPDGPLTWGEIDQVRTDVFSPALAGLLPDRPVRSGERWNAADAAVRELTDMARLDEGGLVCEFQGVTAASGRRLARVSFRGSVRGPGEDGPTRHDLDGYLFFDLDGQFLSYLSMRGAQSLLDAKGQPVGKVEGNFVMTRRPLAASALLSDAALRGVPLEPTAENTLLLYDSPELGVRFLYPRRWHVAGVRGRQVALDEPGGSGILVTVEPPARVPTGAQFLQESRAYLEQQKVKVVRADPPRPLQQAPTAVEQFALDLDAGGQRPRMDYYVVRDALGGATVAARLQAAGVAVLQPEVRRVVQSLRVTRKQ